MPGKPRVVHLLPKAFKNIFISLLKHRYKRVHLTDEHLGRAQARFHDQAHARSIAAAPATIGGNASSFQIFLSSRGASVYTVHVG